MTLKTAMTIAVSAAFAAPLAAQAMGSSGFSRLDDNHDGYISQSEWNGAGQGQAMRDGQANRSGAAQQTMTPDLVVVTITPLAPPTADQQRESIFRSLDANSDGYVSRNEAASNGELNPHFAQLDGDRDGRLSRTEFNRVHPGSQQQASSKGQEGGSAGAGGTSQDNQKAQRSLSASQPAEAVGAPAQYPATPSSGNQPRPGPSWNPTHPKG